MLNDTMKKNNIKKYKIIRRIRNPNGIYKHSLVYKKHNYFLAGTLGGAVRPSSGSFLRIQEWAIKCSKLLQTNNKIISHHRKNC